MHDVGREVDLSKWLPQATDVRSYSIPAPRRTVWFAELSDDQLRDWAKTTGPGKYEKYSRAMLLALLHNRWPCGYYIEIMEAPT